MIAARDTAECQRLGRWLTAHLDGELDAVHNLEVEEHLETCTDCQDVLVTLRATRASLRQVVPMSAPLGLRERIGQSLAGERGQSAPLGDASPSPAAAEQAPSSQVEPGASVGVDPARPRRAHREPIGLRYVVPLAAAATVALVVGAIQLRQQDESTAKQSPREATSASVQGSSLDSLIDDLVAQHVHPPPPETTDPEGLERFDPYVGVRVRRPKFDRADAQYVGARMQRRGALLQYVLRDRRRVTVYVFDPKKVSMTENRLEARQIGKRQVYVGNVRGYTVAASERNGIGWALASELNDAESAKMVLSAAR
jgi:anti-sigma factor RsiW